MQPYFFVWSACAVGVFCVCLCAVASLIPPLLLKFSAEVKLIFAVRVCACVWMWRDVYRGGRSGRCCVGFPETPPAHGSVRVRHLAARLGAMMIHLRSLDSAVFICIQLCG